MTHVAIVMGSAAAPTDCFRCNAVASPALRGPVRGGPVGPPRQLALSGGKPVFLDVQLAAQAPATSSRPAPIAGREMVLGVMCMGAAAFPTTTRQSGGGNSDSRPLFCSLALSSSDDALTNGAAAAPSRSYEQRHKARPVSASATETGGGGGDGGSGSGGGGTGGGGGGGGGSEEEDSDKEKNRAEALAALAAAGKVLQSLPGDLAQAITSGRVPAEVVRRYVGLEGSPLFRYLMQFGGFKERLLADDLFLTKVAIECGVGLFTKTAAEYEKRRGNFFKELDFVIADVIMALIADFMLVWLPAPTVALRPSLATGASALATFFFNCPDNAFQVAMRGTSYTTLQRLGAIVRNGGKLLGVGTVASLFGTAMTNGLQQLRKVGAPKGTEATADAAESGEGETKVPILATSVAYGVYMAVSSNLRYQVLAGVVEQRFLEPLLEKNKLALSLLSFVARTGNTFLGSLLWVDYARWVGVQTHE